jgi:Icc-related predicted phosphoesterase
MKIALASDLHLEFGPLELKNDESADVLVLSGDILVERDLDVWDRRQVEFGCMREKSMMFHKFMQNCSNEFPHVVYVAGNHEHYHGDYANTIPELKRKLSYLENVHVLDKEVFKVDGVTFIGGTLWTDMNKEDPLTLYHIKSMMNDFRIVSNSSRQVTFRASVPKDKPVGMSDTEWLALPIEERYRNEFKTREATFCPEDALEDHKAMMQFIQGVIEGRASDKFVVCGHHAPSRLSTHPKYANQDLMNGGYSSSLDEYIMDHPQIKLWTHGHTHEDFDYMIGSTRIVCNPRGYHGYEGRADKWKLKFYEV